MARASISNTKKVDHSSRKIDDFFPRRSQGSVASSSQPSSSQPTASQSLSQPVTPASSQPQTHVSSKLNTNNSKDRRSSKNNAPPRAGQEVITLSESHSGPISISDDAASHISISSSDPKAVIVISDTSSAGNSKMPKHPLSSASAVKKTKTKDKAAAKSTTSTSKSRQPLKPVAFASTPTTSSAKTTVRRRSALATSTLSSVSASASAAVPVPKKRKHGLQDFDSPSECSADGSVYIADPERLPSSLSHAPVTLRREDLIPDSVFKPRDNTTSSADGRVKGSRTSSTTSKRLRLSPPSPSLPPVNNDVPSQDNIPDVDLALDPGNAHDITQAASSGNEADEEEVPSSQSDEHELTVPKAIMKDPQAVKERVDSWRRTSGVSSTSGSVAADVSPLSNFTGLPSDLEHPPSSPAMGDAHTEADVPNLALGDSFTASEPHDFDDQVMMDVDAELPEAPPLSETNANTSHEHELEEEAEVSRQLELELPTSTSITSLSTLSSGDLVGHGGARPVTPPALAQSLSSIAIASAEDSPFKNKDLAAPSTPVKPKSISDSPFKAFVDSPFKPLPDVDFFRELPSASKEEPQDQGPTPAAPRDMHQRAQDVIERIKAQAAAAAALAAASDDDSDEEKKVDWNFDEGSESSDDEGLQFRYEYKKGAKTPPDKKTASGVKSPPTGGSSESAAGPSTRYNLRRRVSPNDSSPSELPVPPRRVQDKGKTKASASPLAQMLRDKTKADKRGVGMDAFVAAEAAAAEEEAREARERARAKGKGKGKGKGADGGKRNKGKMREEMDEEECELNGFSKGLNLKSSSSSSDSDEEDMLKAEDDNLLDAVALLGSEDGEAVRKILIDDRDAVDAGRRCARGVRIFDTRKNGDCKDEDTDGVAMDVDSDNSSDTLKLPFRGEDLDADPVLSLLRVAVDMHDISRVCRYLTPALVTRVKTQYASPLVAWLFELATSPSQDLLLTQRAFESLIAIARHSLPIANLPQLVLGALLRLGADSDVMERVGLPMSAVVCTDAVAEETRHGILTRVVSIVRTFAENTTIAPDDQPDLILTLLPIALEPSTSLELQMDIMVTIDIVAGCIPSSSDGFSPLEPEICAKALAYAAKLKPSNKALLLSFFCGGSPQTARIARYLARLLLLSEETSEETYSDCPPLKLLISLISPPNGSEKIFDIPGNYAKPDYFEDLASHVEILNVALNDVDSYVRQEKEKGDVQPTSSSYGSPGRAVEKASSELEQIKHLLDRLHGKIADTRSVDLARSSAKAALQQLAIRIHYTRQASKGRATSRPNGGLKSWLKPMQMQRTVLAT